MDERIVDFNELKNKAREKDVDKLEQYMYSLYYSLAQGQITMADFTSKIKVYMDENNISQEKFLNIQKEIMKRYGFNMEDIENQMKAMGIDMPSLNSNLNYEEMRKTLSFQEKYKGKIGSKMVTTYSIKNIANDVEIILHEENVILKSNGKINLQDNELNEFLCSYKKVIKDKQLKISICENEKIYEY